MSESPVPARAQAWVQIHEQAEAVRAKQLAGQAAGGSRRRRRPSCNGRPRWRRSCARTASGRSGVHREQVRVCSEAPVLWRFGSARQPAWLCSCRRQQCLRRHLPPSPAACRGRGPLRHSEPSAGLSHHCGQHHRRHEYAGQQPGEQHRARCQHGRGQRGPARRQHRARRRQRPNFGVALVRTVRVASGRRVGCMASHLPAHKMRRDVRLPQRCCRATCSTACETTASSQQGIIEARVSVPCNGVGR